MTGLLALLDPGTLAGWLTLAAVVIAAFAVWRGGGGTALAVLQEANRVLEKRVRELERLHDADVAEISKLSGKTDFVLAVAPLTEWTASHERRAQQRHEATLDVLALIADRLGPDTSENGP